VVFIEVSSPPTTKDTGAMGREIESRLGAVWYLLTDENNVQKSKR
jgi:hypothetical protein